MMMMTIPSDRNHRPVRRRNGYVQQRRRCTDVINCTMIRAVHFFTTMIIFLSSSSSSTTTTAFIINSQQHPTTIQGAELLLILPPGCRRKSLGYEYDLYYSSIVGGSCISQRTSSILRPLRSRRLEEEVGFEDDGSSSEADQPGTPSIIGPSSPTTPTSSSSISSKREIREQQQRQLLHDLDSAFQYEGRLPSKQQQQQQLPSSPVPSSSSSLNDDTDDDNYNNRNDNMDVPFRCGYVSIIGAPNMGKSTLLNSLLQEELCITTRRPQTTRHAILGVLTTPTTQCCLIDTPGIISDPSYLLQEGMMEAVKGAAFADSDALLVVTDLYSTPIPDDDIFTRVVQRSEYQPVIVVVNKIDLVGRANTNSKGNKERGKDDAAVVEDGDDDYDVGRTMTVPEAVAKWRLLLPNALAIIPLSASDGPDNPGVSLLRRILVGGGGDNNHNDDNDLPSLIRGLGRPVPGMFKPGVRFLTRNDTINILPAGPPLYDEDALTDRSERFFCAELIREALLETFNKEIPYCCEVRVTDFKEPKTTTTTTAGGKSSSLCSIQATIFVERESQKPIVVGKGGEQIKQVGMIARKKIERFLGYDNSKNKTKVFLQLTVKVNKDWRKKEDRLVEFGYLTQKKK